MALERDEAVLGLYLVILLWQASEVRYKDTLLLLRGKRGSAAQRCCDELNSAGICHHW